jgi:transcriptional regulator with XRE-family HTH domain
MTLAEVLETERQRQTLSVNALARAAQQSPGRVHAVLSGETANPRLDTLVAILTGLGRSLTWLDRQLRG